MKLEIKKQTTIRMKYYRPGDIVEVDELNYGINVLIDRGVLELIDDETIADTPKQKDELQEAPVPTTDDVLTPTSLSLVTKVNGIGDVLGKKVVELYPHLEDLRDADNNEIAKNVDGVTKGMAAELKILVEKAL